MSTFSYSDFEDALISHIETNRTGPIENVPIFYPSAPESVASEPRTSPDTHIEVSILPGTSNQADMGAAASRIRRPGIVQFGVFTQYGKGTRRSTEIVDHIVGFMRRATVDGGTGTIVFESAGPVPGLREDAYWRVDVDCRFFSDDFSAGA
jgi:hypothetical protein